MKYKIENVQDILDCTNAENLDNFLIDFRKVLEVGHLMRGYAKLTTPASDKRQVELPSFIWLDDGKHDINLDFTN